MVVVLILLTLVAMLLAVYWLSRQAQLSAPAARPGAAAPAGNTRACAGDPARRAAGSGIDGRPGNVGPYEDAVIAGGIVIGD